MGLAPLQIHHPGLLGKSHPLGNHASLFPHHQTLAIKHQLVVPADRVDLHHRNPRPNRHFPQKTVTGLLLVEAPRRSREIHQKVDPFLG